MSENPERMVGFYHTTPEMGTGLSITAWEVIIDGFPSTASYYSLGRHPHYFVSVRYGVMMLLVL